MHASTAFLLLPLLPLTFAQTTQPSPTTTQPDTTGTQSSSEADASALKASYKAAKSSLLNVEEQAVNDPLGKSISRFLHTQTAIPKSEIYAQQASYGRAIATGASDITMPFVTALPSNLQEYATAQYKSIQDVYQSEVRPAESALTSYKHLTRSDGKHNQTTPPPTTHKLSKPTGLVGTGSNMANGTTATAVTTSSSGDLGDTSLLTATASTSSSGTATAGNGTAPARPNVAGRVKWGVGAMIMSSLAVIAAMVFVSF